MNNADKKLIAVILSGMAIGELLPEPTDALYFWLQDYLMQNKPVLDSLTYYGLLLFSYYCLSAIWYALLIPIFVYWEISPDKRLFAFSGVLSVGAILGLILLMIYDSPSFVETLIMVAMIGAATICAAYAIDRYSRKKKYKIYDR